MSEVASKPRYSRTSASQTGVSVLLLAQLPPPVHGVTTMTARVKNLMEGFEGFRVEQLWAGSAASLDDIDSKSLGKILEFATLNLRLMGRKLGGERYDVVYLTFVPWSHAALRDALIAWWGKRLGRRTLVHLHGEGLEEIAVGRNLKARLVRPLVAGTELIAITSRSAEVAEASGLFARVIRLPNAAPDPGTVDLTTGSTLRFGFLGNLDPRKGVLRFVDTLASLVEAGLPVRGDIAGASTRHLTVEGLRDLIASRGLAAHVTAHGALHGADKVRFLSSLDVMVYLSRHDHAPLVLIEGLASGLVPIAFDTGGVAEIMGPEFGSHVLAPDLSDGQLADSIGGIVRGYLAQPLSLAADRRRARDRYEAQYTEHRFEQRWRQILAEKGPGSTSAATSLHAAQAVRSPLPASAKAPIFALSRALHACFLRRPLPNRIGVYFHALEPADQLALRACVTALRRLGYRTVSYDAYIDPATTGKVLNVSFDDNYKSWHSSLAMLAELKLVATFFTNSLPFRDSCPPAEIEAYFDRLDYAGERLSLSRSELSEIAAAGHEIACHTHSHLLLSALPRDRWEEEILDSKRVLEALSGRPVRHLSWPFGMPRHMTEKVKDYAFSVGFRSISSATPGMLHAGPGNLRDVPRSAWSAGKSVEDNLVDLAIDGRLFTRLTGRSVIG